MALFLEFLTQQWMLALALMVVVTLLVLHEARKSGPSVSPQQAINLINAEEGVFVDLRDSADYKPDISSSPSTFPPPSWPRGWLSSKSTGQARCTGVQDGAAVRRRRQTVKAAGFSRVYKMTGGMMEWSNLQLPVISKS